MHCLKKYLNSHEQNVCRSMVVKGSTGEDSEGSEENGSENQYFREYLNHYSMLVDI